MGMLERAREFESGWRYDSEGRDLLHPRGGGPERESCESGYGGGGGGGILGLAIAVPFCLLAAASWLLPPGILVYDHLVKTGLVEKPALRDLFHKREDLKTKYYRLKREFYKLLCWTTSEHQSDYYSCASDYILENIPKPYLEEIRKSFFPVVPQVFTEEKRSACAELGPKGSTNHPSELDDIAKRYGATLLYRPAKNGNDNEYVLRFPLGTGCDKAESALADIKSRIEKLTTLGVHGVDLTCSRKDSNL